MREAIGPRSSVVTLSRRRLALCAVAAAVALALGFFAGKLFGPVHKHPATPPTAASTSQATATPPAAASTSPASASPPAAASTAPGPATPPASSTPAATAGQVLPTSLPSVSLSDPRTGFQLSYPRVWTRLRTNDATVPLLLSSRDGVSLEVRAVQLSQPITGPRLAVIRDATGQLISRRRQVQIIAGPRLLATANLPGFLYIYSFFDQISHRRVAHSQITLFSGRRMYTLVFQTARAADLPRFAQLFDKITASFRAR